jgi:hypothetical protein
MMTAIVTLFLGLFPSAPVANKPITTCQWPNTCAMIQVAQFQPCVWPNRCAKVVES